MKRSLKINYLAIVSAIVFVLFLGVCSFNLMFPLRYKSYIKEYSKAENLNATLLASLIKTESNFNKNAVSKKGAIGLMQILPATGKWICETYFDFEFDESMLYEPETNIKIGAKYLSYLFTKFDDEVAVLACYNAGEGVVKNWIGENKMLKKTQIQFEETQKYVQKVQNCKKIYKIRFL